MAEIEPASDKLVAAAEAEANEVDAFWGDLAGVKIAAGQLRAILARLRKAEADIARLTEAIDEAEKHGPEVVHFIRAMAKGGGNG